MARPVNLPMFSLLVPIFSIKLWLNIFWKSKMSTKLHSCLYRSKVKSYYSPALPLISLACDQ